MSAPVGLSFSCETLLIGIFQYTSIVTGAKEDRWYFLALLAFHFITLRANIPWKAVMRQWTWPAITESVKVKTGDLRD